MNTIEYVQWFDAVIVSVEDGDKYMITYDYYDNTEIVSLGEIKLIDEDKEEEEDNRQGDEEGEHDGEKQGRHRSRSRNRDGNERLSDNDDYVSPRDRARREERHNSRRRRDGDR